MDLTREQIEQRRELLINVLKRDGHDPASVGIADTNTLCDMALRACAPEARSTLEEAILDTAMSWYRFTVAEGLSEDDYRGESKAQWLACKAFADSPCMNNSPTKGE
jgi:hypothetical protein